MLNTSSAFKDAVYGVSRRTVGRVTFDITDVTAYGDASSITATAEETYSDSTQLVDRKRMQSYKLATLEKDRFKLDGSFSFPDDVKVNNGEVGYVSSGFCDSAGSFYVNNLAAPSANTAQFIGWNWFTAVTATITQGYADPLGGNNATRVVASGGTNVLKVYRDVGPGAAGSAATFSIWVKNQSSLNARINTQFGGLTIPANSGWTKFSFSVTVNGTSNRQLRLETAAVGDTLDILVFQPQITETSYEQPFTIGTSVLPSVTIDFGSVHSSAALTITFDTIGGEYATDYDVSAYGDSGNLITTVSVTGNGNVIDEPLGQLLNYKRLVITVRKWSVGNRRARIVEVDFGIVKVYTGDSLIKMGLVEELDLDSSTIPTAEFNFEVDNTDRIFNILNPTGFYKYLQQRQRIYGELGVELDSGNVEYVPLGSYYLSEWVSNEGSMTASFTAQTALNLMSSYQYEQLNGNNQTIAQLAAQIFSICGIVDYSIDASLALLMTNSMAKKMNCKNALQMLAIAACCNVFVDRHGVIKLEPVTLAGVSIDSITAENTYSEPQITLERVIKQVDVSYWTDLEKAAGVYSVSSGVTDGDTLSVEGNTFINDATRARAVGMWILQQNTYRAKTTANWRGNPAQELADIVDIENSYGSNQTAIITKTNLTYEGYLRVQSEARGVAN